jgi:hypothetical protein
MAALKKLWEEAENIYIYIYIKVIQNLCFNTMLREKYYIELHVSCT